MATTHPLQTRGRLKLFDLYSQTPVIGAFSPLGGHTAFHSDGPVFVRELVAIYEPLHQVRPCLACSTATALNSCTERRYVR